MADVFVSYARKDRSVAAFLAKALAASGFSVWWDQRIGSGEIWDEKIQSELTDAICVCVLWSVAAWQSSYVRAEAHEAHRRGALLMARIDDVQLGAPFNIIQALDLRGWSGETDHPAVAGVIEAIRSRVGVQAGKLEATTYVQELRQRAEAGEAKAQYELARKLAAGEDVERDDVEAVRFYRLAASQGHIWAHCNLAALLAEGRGAPQDWALAVHHYRIAAEAEDWLAQNKLGSCYLEGRGVAKDLRFAFYWYQRSAKGGFASGQANYGMMLRNGWGCDPNPAQAVEWYRKASAQGLASAHNSLGDCYREGVGVGHDLWEAIRYFRMAAEQGHAGGQVNLGHALFHGRGVEKSEVEAVRWYRKASAQGDAQGQNNLGCCLRDGTGCSRNYDEALALFELAAEADNRSGMYNLGRLLEDGLGCVADPVRARELIVQSARLGYEAAQRHLDKAKVAWRQGDGRGQSVLGALTVKQWLLVALSAIVNSLALSCVVALVFDEQIASGHYGASGTILVEASNWMLQGLHRTVEAASRWGGYAFGADLRVDRNWPAVFLIGFAMHVGTWFSRDMHFTSAFVQASAGALVTALAFAVMPPSPVAAEGLRAAVIWIGALTIGHFAVQSRFGPVFQRYVRMFSFVPAILAFLVAAALAATKVEAAAILTFAGMVGALNLVMIFGAVYAPASLSLVERNIAARSALGISLGYAAALLLILLMSVLR